VLVLAVFRSQANLPKLVAMLKQWCFQTFYWRDGESNLTMLCNLLSVDLCSAVRFASVAAVFCAHSDHEDFLDDHEKEKALEYASQQKLLAKKLKVGRLGCCWAGETKFWSLLTMLA
jgi:hypothetical protein